MLRDISSIPRVQTYEMSQVVLAALDLYKTQLTTKFDHTPNAPVMLLYRLSRESSGDDVLFVRDVNP